MKKETKSKGITLIALIITIIVMLILVGVTVNVALNGGLFDKAKEAAEGMNMAQIQERAEMIKTLLVIDMETEEDVIIATKEFKTRLANELGGVIQNNKVVVSNGKYDIVVKNANLDFEVKEHNNYVNMNSIWKTYYETEEMGEEGIAAAVKIKDDFGVTITKEGYIALRAAQETINNSTASIDQIRAEVIADLEASNTLYTGITSTDEYVVRTLKKLYPTINHDKLDDWVADESVKTEAKKLGIENLTKEHFYAIVLLELQPGETVKATEEEAVRSLYAKKHTDTTSFATEYEKATEDIALKIEKNGTEIENPRFPLYATENGEYKISIITSDGTIINEEKIVINNIKDIQGAITESEAEGIWKVNVLGKITDYLGTDTNVKIPMVIGQRVITQIGDGVFEDCISLTNVTIPNSVTTIKGWAFEGCTSLESITIPDSVTTIGQSAFSGCTSLTKITIPNSVTTIGAYAFSSCTSLKEITIPNSVTTIEQGAFDGCTSLTNITIPNSVTAIEGWAFEGCTSLESITIPDSVTTIGQNAFSGCTSLTNITISNSVTTISQEAFSGCTSLASITIPNSVTTIGISAFSSCTSLTSITIPDSVKTIRTSAFSGCKSLTTITIPNSVTTIGSSAFSGCDNLNDIYFVKGTNAKPSGETWGATNATVTEIDPPKTEE